MIQNRPISDRKALQIIRPKSREDRWSLLRLGIYFAGIVFIVIGLLYLKKIDRERREAEWNSVTATIEDARPKLVTQSFSERGGAMLYSVEVLAKYPKDGVMEEQWITVAHPSKLLADAQLDAFRWKGQSCTVRWKLSDPTHVVADAS